jgi:hypothetical protein
MVYLGNAILKSISFDKCCLVKELFLCVPLQLRMIFLISSHLSWVPCLMICTNTREAVLLYLRQHFYSFQYDYHSVPLTSYLLTSILKTESDNSYEYIALSS